VLQVVLLLVHIDRPAFTMRYAAAEALSSVLQMQLDIYGMILAMAQVSKDSTAAALTTEATLRPH
jgi:uncharacterized membrane protein